MSDQLSPSLDTQFALLQSTWVECFQTVLSQVSGSAVSVEPEAESEPTAAEADSATAGMRAMFAATEALQGGMMILAADAAAFRLGHILLTDAKGSEAPADQDARDAYTELLSQVAGHVATSLKAAAGGDVEIRYTGNEAPDWPDANRTTVRISGEKLDAIRITIVLSAEIAESLRAQQEKGPATELPPALPEEEISSPQPEPSGARNSNLELLLDVTLDATICFGQTHMLLRDVLELHPGDAVILDRHLEEPVDLLVGGRMMARGEVVIVNGNYGLRITEIVSPQQRIASLVK